MIDAFLSYRRGLKLKWLVDEKRRYYEGTGYTQYGPNDFDYRFNDAGFRCDSFQEEAELPIIFLGCSFTEGYGLPYDHTWAYRLVDKLRTETGQKIPYWNLAAGGVGVDFIAEAAYWFSKNVASKPRYIFVLFPDFHRRISSFCGKLSNWQPSQIHHSAERKEIEIMTDEHYALFQTERSLKILEQTRALWNARLIGMSWSHFGDRVFKRFPNFEMLEMPPWPEKDTRARDRLHWGPEFHELLTESYYRGLKSDIEPSA